MALITDEQAEKIRQTWLMAGSEDLTRDDKEALAMFLQSRIMVKIGNKLMEMTYNSAQAVASLPNLLEKDQVNEAIKHQGATQGMLRMIETLFTLCRDEDDEDE